MSITRSDIPFGAPFYFREDQVLQVRVVVPDVDRKVETVLAIATMPAIHMVSKVTVEVEGPDTKATMTGHPWQTIEEIAKYVEGDGTDSQRVALADGIRRKHI